MYTKYPQTLHLPWSNCGRDDKIAKDLSGLKGQRVVVTEKMDGENTTLYNDYIHARSLEILRGDVRSMVLSRWSSIRNNIPDGLRICGENLEAMHSIYYEDLEDYFLVFGIWDQTICYSWPVVEDFCRELGLKTVPVLYRGLYDESVIRSELESLDFEKTEGYVVRLEGPFEQSEFQNFVFKYVRPNHVQTDQHWMHKPKFPNRLKGSCG